MTDPGHASDHGDRRAPGNARLSLFKDHQGQRDRTGGGYQEYNYKMSKLRVLPIFWDQVSGTDFGQIDGRKPFSVPTPFRSLRWSAANGLRGYHFFAAMGTRPRIARFGQAVPDSVTWMRGGAVHARLHKLIMTTIGVSDYGPWLISTSRSLIRGSRRGCRRHRRTHFRISRS